MAYIGYFPTENGFNAVRFRQQTITKKTETASGRIIRATNATTKWTGTLRFPPMTYAEWLPVQAFISRCQGPLNEFDIILPVISDNLPIVNQVTVPNANASAGATNIEVLSDQLNTTILKAGNTIRFHNHSKVYMVTEDVTTDSGGVATIYFQPNLVVAVESDSAGFLTDSAGTGDAITTTQVPFRMILSNDIQEFDYRTDGLIEYEIDVQEVV